MTSAIERAEKALRRTIQKSLAAERIRIHDRLHECIESGAKTERGARALRLICDRHPDLGDRLLVDRNLSHEEILKIAGDIGMPLEQLVPETISDTDSIAERGEILEAACPVRKRKSNSTNGAHH
ncbi:MAG: hypothetical protein PHV93_00425 [Candidatus Pacebacteria bacterium]|nr:hypothetical protein [Candidatus Paceibacterota bacterium]